MIGQFISTTAIVIALIVFLLSIILSVTGIPALISLIFLFNIAEKPGWAAIIPFYNIIVILQIIKKPLWWFFLLLIPIVNIPFILITIFEFTRRFGAETKSESALMVVMIMFLPLFALNSASYVSDEGFTKQH